MTEQSDALDAAGVGEQPPVHLPTAVPAASAPPSFDPYAAPVPGSTVPIPVVLAPLPGDRRGAALTIVLAVVAGVLLLVAGGAGALYYRDHTDSQQQITDLQARLDDTEQELADARADLRTTQGELDDAKACSDAVDAFWKVVLQVAGGSVNTATANAAATEMLRSCGVSR